MCAEILPKECPGRQMCRYQRYLEEAKKQDVFILICNHNYLLADAYHRAEGYKPLLSDYRTLIVDEAHKLLGSGQQMFGKICVWMISGKWCIIWNGSIRKKRQRILRTVIGKGEALRDVVGAEQRIGKGIRKHSVIQ